MKQARLMTAGLAMFLIGLLGIGGNGASWAAETGEESRDRLVRQRYETVLIRNPFQERAFNQVYESYLGLEGVDRWVENLKPKVDGPEGLGALLLLGQIHDRQFKTVEALESFEKAARKGENRPQFKILLGTLYYKAGKDDLAGALLTEALETLTDLDQRANVCRMLGNLYLRQGKRDEAIKAWKRISEQNPDEIFAAVELAEIYEDNRMWDEAIGVYRQIAGRSAEDPYRKCRALRSIGQCLVLAEKHAEAIATYEEALALVSPGNWLFEDLKLRLVAVYEDVGDLDGLAKYLEAKLAQNPLDAEFRDLLAETFSRMGRFAEAEKEYRALLERNPKSSSIYEKLIQIHHRTGQKQAVIAAFEKLIELYPKDADYLRRLGEFHLAERNPELAKQTWARVAGKEPTGEQLAAYAGWLEDHEFPEDAIGAYERALAKTRQRDWILRLAALRFQKGEEESALKLWLSSVDPAASKVEDYAEVASILEANQKLAEAEALRKTALEKDPGKSESRLAYAKILMRQEKFERALAEFEKLAEDDGNDYLRRQGENGLFDAWRELGLVDRKQGEIEQALEANPADAKKLGLLARLLERGGQREKAIALYEGRREKDPGNLDYLRALASLYEAGKQTDLAVSAYRGLLEKDKNRARVYQKQLLDIFLGADLKEEALAAAEAFASLAPGDPEARLTLAQVYGLYRQTDKALNEYRFALRLAPNEPDYHRQYAEALEQDKRHGEAQEAFRKMLEAAKEDGTRLSAVASLARVHLQQDRLAELIAEFQRRVRNTPKKLAAHEELAAIYKESGQIFRSVEVLENGLQLVDDKAAALKVLVRMAYEAQDFAKVKNSFEQLIAISGKPSAGEFERLGQIHAQLGDIEKAKSTWNQILAGAPKDSRAYDRVAKLLRDNGFTDESLLVKTRAVELDPGDYKRRFEFAQWLAQNQQPAQAMEQVQLLLEAGDREEAEAKASEKKAPRLNRAPPPAISPYQFMQSGRMYGAYFGGGWQGSFRDFRPSVVQFLATLAQQSIGEEAFIEQLTDRVKKPGATGEQRRDLLTVLQMFNRLEEAMKVGEELLAASPHDPDLTMRVALIYSDQQKLDRAIALLERVAGMQTSQRGAAMSGLVALYLKNKQDAKALESADSLLKEKSSDAQTHQTVAGLLQNNQKFEDARRVLTRLAEIDPRQKDQVRGSLAMLAKQSGKMEEALGLFRESVFSESARPAYYGRTRRVEIYIPEVDPNRGRMYGNPMQGLPQTAFGSMDYRRISALNELKMASSGGTGVMKEVLEEMKRIALQWSPASTPDQRDRALEMAQLLAGYYAVGREYANAAEVLQAVRAAGCEEASWFNAALYVAQQQEDYGTMEKLFAELEQRYPAKARDISIARTHTHLLAKQYDQAAKVIRQLNDQRVPPAQVLGLISRLQAAGEKQAAKELLEEHLRGASRNSQALSMLAALYGEANDFEKAIELAQEAWERKAHGSPQNNSYMFASYYGYMPQVNPGEGLLGELFRYHVGAGKSEELVERFKRILEKQPGSMQAHENLASLYRLGQQRDQALEVYQQLAAKRPHLVQIKRTIASIYQEMGQFDRATKLYEELIKANPAQYQTLQWELRSVYQRQGKGKELRSIEDTIASKARDPNQLMNLAYRMREDGELDKAIDLFRKAAAMAPGQPHFKSQLAGALLEKGEMDEALKTYEEWFLSPQIRTQGFMDHHTLRQFAGLYKANGKLDELRKRCETELGKNAGDRTARALLAHAAALEKRFDDALTAFKALLESGNDPNIIGQLVDLAGFSGKVKEVLAVAERADGTDQSWDSQRLASLYMAAGDKKKAHALLLKWSESMVQQGNASWAIQQTMEQMARMQLWDEWEQYAAKHRTMTMQPWEAEELDRSIASRYVAEGRFESIVSPLLTKESLNGRDLSLVQKIAEQYQQANQPDKQRAFLERLVALDPKNRDLAFVLLNLYHRPEDIGKKAALARSLLNADPNKIEYRRAWAEAEMDAGRGADALRALRQWVEDKPMEPRWSLLSQLQARAGRPREARQSLNQALEIADKARKVELSLQLARFDAQFGDSSAEGAALREQFGTRQDAQSFQAYWRFLQQNGYPAEAHALFASHKDKGFFDQYQQQDFVDFCLDQGDFSSAADLNWRFTRYGNRWERDYYFDRVAKVYRDRAKLGWFVEDFAKRVGEDPAVNDAIWIRAARSWEQAGEPGKALEIYDQQLRKKPFHRLTAQHKAGLLLKLNRFDEAIPLLKEIKGVMSLEDESGVALGLARMLFAAGRIQEAETEIEALLNWDKRPQTRMQAGNLLMEHGQFARALKLFQEAAAGVQDWNYEELVACIGRCHAKLGQPEGLIKAMEELQNISQNLGWRMDTLQAWLMTEGFFDLAARANAARLEKSPERVDWIIALANSLARAGRIAEAFQTMEEANRRLIPERSAELSGQFAGLLLERNLVNEAVERRARAGSGEPFFKFLTAALIAAWNQAPEKWPAIQVLASAAPPLEAETPELQMTLGGAFAKSHRKDEASKWYRRALQSTNDTVRLHAAIGLARNGSGQDPDAAGVLGEVLRKTPHWFVQSESMPNQQQFMPVFGMAGVIFHGSMGMMGGYQSYQGSAPSIGWEALVAALARCGDDDLIKQLEETLAAGALNEAQAKFYQAQVLQHRGLTNEARAKWREVLEEPKLTSAQANLMENALLELGLTEERAKALKRRLAPGSPVSGAARSVCELIKHHARTGELKEAVSALGQFRGTWGMLETEEAREVLAKAVGTENYPAFRAAIVETTRAMPASDFASHIIGYGQQVAQRLGIAESAASLAAASEVSDQEKAEAGAWDHLIEQWEVAGPFHGAPNDGPAMQSYYDPNQPPQAIRARLPEIKADLVWKTTDPRRELGVIQLGAALGLDKSETTGVFAYARTTLASPDDKPATLLLGADDWVQVWVNGQYVFGSMEPRSCVPDQDRIPIMLKRGDNQVLLRIGNQGDAWGFCLRVAEAGGRSVAGLLNTDPADRAAR